MTGPRAPTLTYCTNIHPSQTLLEIQESLQTWTLPLAAQLRQDFGWTGSFPVGLYLSAESVTELEDPVRRREWGSWLHEHELQIATLNCFPFGGFHSPRVKHAVFRPGWHETARRDYTKAAASRFVDWLPEGGRGSISTSSGTWKAWQDDTTRSAIAQHWVETAVHLHWLEQESGKQIVLAIEPEPMSTLETTEEVVAFFETMLFCHSGRERAAKLGVAPHAAEELLRRHLTLCYDTCHQAVEFEQADAALERLHRAGVNCGKVQLSNALRLRNPGRDSAGREFLAGFAEPRYLHQAIARDHHGNYHRFEDLPEFLAADQMSQFEEVRVHFHIPIDVDELPLMQTTREHMTELIAAAAARDWADLYEVETYTFDVFPKGGQRGPLKTNLNDCLRGELQFAHAELARHGLAAAAR